MNKLITNKFNKIAKCGTITKVSTSHLYFVSPSTDSLENARFNYTLVQYN